MRGLRLGLLRPAPARVSSRLARRVAPGTAATAAALPSRARALALRRPTRRASGRDPLALLPLALRLAARVFLLLLALARAALVLGALGREGGLVLLAPLGIDLLALGALLLGQEARDGDENFGATRLVADTRDDLFPHCGLRVGDDGGEPARVREEHAREGHAARRSGFFV